jgi:hypothetical protein
MSELMRSSGAGQEACWRSYLEQTHVCLCASPRDACVLSAWVCAEIMPPAVLEAKYLLSWLCVFVCLSVLSVCAGAVA